MKKNKTLVAPHILFIFAILTGWNVSASDFNRNTLDKEQQKLSSELNFPESAELSGIRFGEAEKKIRIVVDPGHGGKDQGAQGYHGALEKEICLKVAKQVRREIERYSKTQGVPIEIKLSRDGDDFIPLRERAKLANTWGADLFVSVHANSSPVPKAKGFEVYFLSPEATDEQASKLARLENQAPPAPVSAQVISILSDATTQYHVAESSQLAETMFSSVSQKIASNGRGVRQAPFTVLHGTNMPAVLVEIGYVTNLEESKNLMKDSYLKKVASAITGGIVEFATRTKKVRNL
jgi:N-acetylmuramoyl-L-alanine amidase